MQAFALANPASRISCKVVCQQGCCAPLLDDPAEGGGPPVVGIVVTTDITVMLRTKEARLTLDYIVYIEDR